MLWECKTIMTIYFHNSCSLMCYTISYKRRSPVHKAPLCEGWGMVILMYVAFPLLFCKEAVSMTGSYGSSNGNSLFTKK